METNMGTAPRTWKPTVAGILDIVGGALSILGAIALLLGILFFMPISSSTGPDLVPEMGCWMIPGIVEAIIVIAAVYLLIVGVLPIVGGIYALRRKKWGLALAGSIAAIFGPSVMGILATVFIAMSRDEFE
jgi:hypothetical protein